VPREAPPRHPVLADQLIIALKQKNTPCSEGCA
jgi:hypothetical protein